MTPLYFKNKPLSLCFSFRPQDILSYLYETAHFWNSGSPTSAEESPHGSESRHKFQERKLYCEVKNEYGMKTLNSYEDMA